jgi:hypothetical protein
MGGAQARRRDDAHGAQGSVVQSEASAVLAMPRAEPEWAELPDLALELIAQYTSHPLVCRNVCKAWRVAASGVVGKVVLLLSNPRRSQATLAAFPSSTKIILRWDRTVMDTEELDEALQEHSQLLQAFSSCGSSARGLDIRIQQWVSGWVGRRAAPAEEVTTAHALTPAWGMQ